MFKDINGHGYRSDGRNLIKLINVHPSGHVFEHPLYVAASL